MYQCPECGDKSSYSRIDLIYQDVTLVRHHAQVSCHQAQKQAKARGRRASSPEIENRFDLPLRNDFSRRFAMRNTHLFTRVYPDLLVYGAISLIKRVMTNRRHYPYSAPFFTVLQADDGPREAKNGVIRNGDELQRILPTLAPILKDRINFEKEELIFVALGKRKSRGYEARIRSITLGSHRNDGISPFVEVSYAEYFTPVPPPEGAKEMEPSFPVHVVKTKKLDGDISFNGQKFEKDTAHRGVGA